MLLSYEAFADDDLMKAAKQNFRPIPSIVSDVKDNSLTRDKIELGKLLLF